MSKFDSGSAIHDGIVIENGPDFSSNAAALACLQLGCLVPGSSAGEETADD
jgi:hypothetical protein